tara:strand:- start:17 stop:472 length:456 start_codon:yes stop_codon:yes gene_type:complete
LTLALTFPGGQLKTVTISATAGNANADLSPGSGVRWQILYGNIELSTSGDVQNRTFRVSIVDGSANVLLYMGYSSQNIPASTTGYLGFAGLDSASNRHITVGGWAGYPQFFSLDPHNLIIEGSDIMRIEIGNGHANDSFEGFIRVLAIGGA